MKAQDLRIGNLVYFNNNNIGTITEIKSSLISEPSFLIGINNRIDIYYDIYNLKFVPLTEEILLKCGFEKIDNNWKILDCVCLKLSWERLAVFWVTFENESICLPHIKYLHQLQNLILSLTNEELTINL